MIATPHIFFGAMLGKWIGNPFLTIIISFLTHYLLDLIPHYQPRPIKGYKEGGLREMDKKDWLLKSIEPTLGISFLAAFIFTAEGNTLSMMLGAFFGFLPDFIWFIEWKFGYRLFPFPTFQLEHKYHRHVSFIKGIVPQIIVTLVSIWILLL